MLYGVELLLLTLRELDHAATLFFQSDMKEKEVKKGEELNHPQALNSRFAHLRD